MQSIVPFIDTTVPFSPSVNPYATAPDDDNHDCRLAEEIAILASHIEAATYRLLCLIREFDERGGWYRAGARSCAHYLNWRIGWGLPAARERVRVARALGELPLLSDALSAGKISYSKVRAITRIATPDNEDVLVEYAYHNTASQIEKVVRGYRGVERAQDEELEDRRHLGRELNTWNDDNGMVVIQARLTPELGAAVLKALEVAEAALPPRGDGEPDAGVGNVSAVASERKRPTAPQRRADALGLIAQSALDHQMKRGSAGDRTQIVLHVDGDGDGDLGVGRLEPNLHVGAETVRRLSCDASAVTMRHGADGSVLDVGRKTRTIPPAIRRALQARQSGCQYPGCSHTRFLDAHHVKHWADGGETKLSNLVHLCSFHHGLVHEGGVRVSLDTSGELTFRDIYDRQVVAAPPLPGVDATAETLEQQNEAQGLQIDQRTFGLWDGYQPDYSWGVEVLWQRRKGES